MNYPLVELEWVDSATLAGWRAVSTEHPVVSCFTAGYLVSEHDDRYVVAAAIDGEGECASVMVIPKVAVTKFTVLRES